MSAYAALADVAAALRTVGIPFLPVKGIVTAHLLYDDPSTRHLGDIDLRIRRRDFARAVRLARGRDWYRRPDVVLGQALWSIGGWEVDVKAALGPPGLCAITVDEMLERAEPATEPFGFPHFEPELHDHALLLAINAFKDGLRALPWSLEDLRRMVVHRQFDDKVLVERAARGGVRTALWLTATWLADEQGMPQWRAVADRIGTAAPSRRAAWVYERWRRAGTAPKRGLFVVAAAGDRTSDAIMGVGLAAAGVMTGRALRVVDRLRGKAELRR